jgi:DHA1 family multidrug resistance protein-like MFS transporter
MADAATSPLPAITSTAQTPRSTDSTIAEETPRKSDNVRNKSQDALPDIEKGSNNDTSIPVAKDTFLVEFEGPNDPGNPKSWTTKRRWGITASMGLMVFTVTFASSIFSVNIGVVRENFKVEMVTATLGVALFVLVRWAFPLVASPAAN